MAVGPVSTQIKNPYTVIGNGWAKVETKACTIGPWFEKDGKNKTKGGEKSES